MIIFKNYNLTLMNADPAMMFEDIYTTLYIRSEELLDVIFPHP